MTDVLRLRAAEHGKQARIRLPARHLGRLTAVLGAAASAGCGEEAPRAVDLRVQLPGDRVVRAAVEGDVLAFRVRVDPPGAAVQVRGARSRLVGEGHGALVVRLAGLRRGTTRVALAATDGGATTVRRVEILRRPSGVGARREPQAAEDTNFGSPGNLDVTEGKIDLGIRDFAFFPPLVRAVGSQVVSWHNLDRADHVVVLRAAAGASVRSGRLGADDRFQLSLPRRGDVRYRCAIHPWMRGRIRVR